MTDSLAPRIVALLPRIPAGDEWRGLRNVLGEKCRGVYREGESLTFGATVETICKLDELCCHGTGTVPRAVWEQAPDGAIVMPVEIAIQAVWPRAHLVVDRIPDDVPSPEGHTWRARLTRRGMSMSIGTGTGDSANAAALDALGAALP